MTTQETIDRAASVLWDALDAADPSGYTDSELGTIDVREVDMRVVARALADAGLLADPDDAALIELAESLTHHACPKGVHPDWFINSEYNFRCPWCVLKEARDMFQRLNRRAQLAEAALHKQLKHPNGAQDPTVNALGERVRDLEATIQRVRDLHHDFGGHCHDCDHDYPCPTIRALDQEASE